MQNPTFALLSLPLLCGLAISQAGPGVSRDEAENAAFKAVSGESQCNFHQFPGQAAGVYTASVTLGSNLVVGIYDQGKQTWTATTEAAALNPNSGNFGLMLDRTGKYCVFDRSDGVYWSYRAKPGDKFAAPVKLNAPLSGYVDPALAYVGSELMLLWTTGTEIRMQAMDITSLSAPKLKGTYAAVAKRQGASGVIHSPSPVNGPDGDIEGLLLAESLGTDMYYKAGLDPNEKHILLVNAGSWSNNGGNAGARFLYIRSGAVRDIEAAYMTGDVEKAGGTIDIGAAAPSKNGNALTFVFLSATTAPPITLPAPWNVGQLGLDLKTLFPLGVIAQKGANQWGSMSFAIPKGLTDKLKGSIQGLSLDLDSSLQSWAFTNSAHLAIN